MYISDKKYSLLAFVALIAALVLFKWHDLYLPFFWDELGVYAQAAYYQYHHGISMMPESVPAVLSRGHPLFFTFLTAGSLRFLGDQIFTIHLFCLCISILLLFVVYHKATKYFGPATGILSCFILAIQPVFLAQSCLVLPEITLALFIILALCSYYEERYLLFALWASLALLTKESAVILPVVVLLYAIIRRVKTGERSGALSFIPVLLTLIPYTVFGLFLLIQKHQNGWYFFPYHIGSVSFSVKGFITLLHTYSLFVFKAQGRYILSIALIAGLIISLLQRYAIGRSGSYFLLLLIIACGAIIGFNSLFAVYLDRYVMGAFVPLAILAAVSLTAISRRTLFLLPVMGILLFISVRHFDRGGFHYDADLSYRRHVHQLQELVDYTMQRLKPGEKVYCNFPAYYAFSFPEGGYLKRRAGDGELINKDGFTYLILCDPVQYDFDQAQFTLLTHFGEGEGSITIYQRNK